MNIPVEREVHVKTKATKYQEVIERIESLIQDETDEISLMATVVCDLYHHFNCFHWVGFYRVTKPELLSIGPYQGAHGCLHIPFSRGVCGLVARTGKAQLIDDIRTVDFDVSCSAISRSQIVVPVFDANGDLRAVLDVDSEQVEAFDQEDLQGLEWVCKLLSQVLVCSPS